MAHIQVPLAEVQAGDKLAHIVRINSAFLVAKPGKDPYLGFSLSDKSGPDFFAKKWSNGQTYTEKDLKKYQELKIALVTGEKHEKWGFVVETLAALGDPLPQQELDELLGPEPAVKPTKGPPSNKKDGCWSFKTKAEVGFDELVKTQKPLRSCEPNETLNHLLRVCSITPGVTSSSIPFVDFMVGDAATPPMKARLWRVSANALDEIKGAKIVHIEGSLELYNDVLQVKFNNDHITIVSDATEADINLLTLSSPYSIKTLANGIWNIVQSFTDPHLKQLCESLLKDPKNKDFRFAPAGVTYHHAWRSGLCEHTFRLMQLVDDFIQLYNTTPLHKNKVKLNRDMILTGALYHDFFKCFEYTVDGGYAPAGNLLKHLSRGIVDVGARTAQIKDFPTPHRQVLAHIIGAHHGKKEWDAIELPACPEALIVHYFDNLCSKLDPTITELNNLKCETGFSTTRLKSLDSVPYIGGCKREKPIPFTTVIFEGETRQDYLAAVKKMLLNIKEPMLREMSLKVFDLNAKVLVSTNAKLDYGMYDSGLVEYIYRTMHFLGNFVNSYNEHEWPTNGIYIDSDYAVAGAFLQNVYAYMAGSPLLENIGTCLLTIGELSTQIEGFPDELRNLICQIVASQGESSPEKAICPDSIMGQYYLPLLFKLDSMNLTLSAESWTADTHVDLFKKKVRLGACQKDGVTKKE